MSLQSRKIIVIDHDFSARLSVIRSLAPLGYEITVIVMVPYGKLGRLTHMHWSSPIDCKSKYVQEYYYCLSTSDEALVQLLLEKCRGSLLKPILIPGSDTAVSIIDRNKDRLGDSFLFSRISIGGEQQSVDYWMDKSVQKDLAKEVGMNVAEGKVFTPSREKFNPLGGISYPCFTKPLASINGGKSYLRRCDDESELRRVMERVANHAGVSLLVEEYKSIDREYALIGVTDGETVVIPGVLEFLRNSQSHLGVALQGVVKPVTGFEDFLDKCRIFVREIGYRGMFDIDFYLSNGKLYFGEINYRFGASGYAYTAAGANLLEIFAGSVAGEGMRDASVQQSMSYVNERMCLDDYLMGYIGKSDCKTFMNAAQIKMVFDQNDPAPYRALLRDLRVMQLKRMLRTIKKKYAGRH